MTNRKNGKSHWREIVLAVVTLVGIGLGQGFLGNDPRPGPVSAPTHETGKSNTVTAAYAARQSGVWMTIDGRVQRLLADDNEGSRHQRFIVSVDGATVLVAHNIDLANRVPLTKNDPVRLRGRYEWNPKGGVLHWTHHDPGGRQEGGWIEYRGRKYR